MPTLHLGPSKNRVRPPCFQKVGRPPKIKIKIQPKQYHNPVQTTTIIYLNKPYPNKKSTILTIEIHKKIIKKKKTCGGKIKEGAVGAWEKDGVQVSK